VLKRSFRSQAKRNIKDIDNIDNNVIFLCIVTFYL
jgi:hypothetical protein